MLWLFPSAVFALIALAGPIVVHILVRQRAERLPFPTLRFIQPHRLASIRRRALEDGALLAVRLAILAAAVAAVAGPLLVSAARQRAWNARTLSVTVNDPDLRDGLVRAVADLRTQQPGRRAIVIRSTFPLGALTTADIAGVPGGIGLRFERTGSLPASRTLVIGAVVQGNTTFEREASLDGARTSVRIVRSSPGARPPLDFVAPPDQQAGTLTAALANERLPQPLPGRSARLVFGATPPNASPISVPWMADAAAAVADRVEVPVSFAADGDRLLATTSARADSSEALNLLRAVARALAAPPEHPSAEVLSIPDEQLRTWTREPGPAAVPTADTLTHDDRRWLWALVLALLGLEWWMRGARAHAKGLSRAA